MAVFLKIKYKEFVSEFRVSSKPLIIGRSRNADISIADSQVSSKHLKVHININGNLVVKDLGSTNGTFLNSSKITDAIIKVGDILTLGENTKLRIIRGKLNNAEEESHIADKEKTKLTFIDINGKQESAVEHATQILKQAQTNIHTRNKLDQSNIKRTSNSIKKKSDGQETVIKKIKDIFGK